jgi:short-subunit dehydrogenase
MRLENATALVTGASNGIGERFALRLADAGTDLVLVARNGDKLDALASAIRAAHPARRVEVIPMDLAQPGSGHQVALAVAELGVRVDMLVNNAGVGSHDRFVDEDPGQLAGQIQLNVTSLVDLTARFLPGMLEAGSGAVVNVASTAAFQPVPTMAVYAATKAFVLSFTEALWGETRGSGVRVLTLCPGATETAFFASTGKEFLTSGRQSPDQVVTTALRGLDGRAPTVVSGLTNRIATLGARFLPRAAMIRFSERLVATSAA